MDRRKFLLESSRWLAAGTLAARTPFALGQTAPDDYVVAETKYGRVRGRRDRGISIFKGIPYGGDVSGQNRFKAAPPPEPWSGIRDALRPGNPSPQPEHTWFGIDEPDPAENCLFLNIWTPAADNQRRPVMIYQHGGGFTTGSGSAVYQDGGNLARFYNVVVVAHNHRLGLMGYLDLAQLGGEDYATSGNQGMLDIRDALRWTFENIAHFGGDPSNMMIFGESGGGAKTSCLYAMPSAHDYFNKASIESGPGVRMTEPDIAYQTTRLALQHLDIPTADWRRVLDVPLPHLMETQVWLSRQAMAGGITGFFGGRKGIGGSTRPGSFGPVVDGKYLPHHPFDPVAPAISRNKPLIVGTNRDEMLFFYFQTKNTAVFDITMDGLAAQLNKQFGPGLGPRVLATYRATRPDAAPIDLDVAIETARFDWLGSLVIAERKFAQHAAPVYMYMFTHASNYIIPGTHHILGAAHALEIPYKFDNLRPGASGNLPNAHIPGMDTIAGTDPGRYQAARNMSTLWTSYARTAHPTPPPGQPAWPPYTLPRRATLLIDTNCRVEDDPQSAERRFWESLPE